MILFPPMRVIARRTLREFWERHPDAEASLKSWFKEARSACWKSPADLKARYPSASILANNRAIFNIRGNNYRLVTAIHFEHAVLYIRFIGTHAEYDQIDAVTI